MKQATTLLLLVGLTLCTTIPQAQDCSAFQSLYSWGPSTGHNTVIISANRAGDVDNDGVTDFIFSTISTSIPPGTHLVYVYSGENGSLLHLLELDGSGPWSYGTGDVCGAGDINGDGFDDFMVGTHSDQGYEISVFSGETGATLQVLRGEGDDGFGLAISWAGDVNNDGHEDVIVGASRGGGGLGCVWVFSGLTGATLHIFTGEAQEQGFGSFGQSVCGAGDVDSDGYADLIVGAPQAQLQADIDNQLSAPGRAYVFSGQSGAKLHTFTHVFEDSLDCWAYLGHAVSGVGDVNNNGYDDVAFLTGTCLTPSTVVVRIYDGNDFELIRTACEDCQFFPQAGVGDINEDFHADYLTIDPEAQQVTLHSGVDNAELSSFTAGEGTVHPNWPYSWAMARDEARGEYRFIIGSPGAVVGPPPQMFSPGRVDVYSCGCGDIGFQPDVNGWGFANDNSSGDFWNSTDGVDYSAPPYPPDWANIDAAVYPSWPLFVEAFGDEQCFHLDGSGQALMYDENNILAPLKDALWWWLSMMESYGGVCFGMATSALSFFDDCQDCLDEQTEFGSGGDLFGYALSIANSRPRQLVNQFHQRQHGFAYWIHKLSAVRKTPTETLRECQTMLASPADHRTLTFQAEVSAGVPFSHAVIPYRCEQHDSNPMSWWIYVSDPNHPGEADWRILIDTEANGGNGEWTYYYGDLRQYAWSDNKIYLGLPSSSISDQPIIPPRDIAWPTSSGRSDSTRMAFIFASKADSVAFESSLGVIGYANGVTFNTLELGIPMTLTTSTPEDPIGFLIPDTAWEGRFSDLRDSIFHFIAFADTAVVVYYRENVDSTQSERIRYGGQDGELWVFNDDATSRDYRFETVLRSADSQVVVAIEDIMAATNDSIKYSRTDGRALQLDNFGGQTTYDLSASIADTSGITRYYHMDIVLHGGSSQIVIPDWRPFGGSVMILSDTAMTGTYSDTTLYSNDYVYTCCVVRGDVDHNGTSPDIADLIYLVTFMFQEGPPLPCPETADINGDELPDPNIADLIYLVTFMFQDGPAPAPCP